MGLVEDHRREFDNEQEKIVAEWCDFLRFPSISAEPQFKPDVLACCEWLQARLRNMGFAVEIWETEGHPTIFASHTKAGSGKGTALFYNHYDVQPVDPLDKWLTSPFEPVERDGVIYARGAQDNKGQCYYVIKALESLLVRNGGELPLNVKLCIDGEEEKGSPGLTKILASKQSELKADHLLVFDVGYMDEAKPTLNVGVRGLVTLTVEFIGSNSDLHSGVFGGIAYNPNRALVEILGSLYDSNGKVTIPGFYDAVVEIPNDERAQLDFNFDHGLFKKIFDAEATGGEKHLSPFESAWLRPSLEINGVGGGYFGEGFKTVIPAKSLAKISCRIVPNQDPDKIGELIIEYIRSKIPEGIKLNARIEPGRGRPARSRISSAVVRAVSKAYQEVGHGRAPSYVLDGASIPIAADLVDVSGAELILAGFGLPTDNIHAPNENFSIDRFRMGFVTVCRTVELLGE